MTYEEAYAALKKVKAFARSQKKKQDRRKKTTELVWEQLDNAYHTSCVVENHLRVAERYEDARGNRNK